LLEHEFFLNYNKKIIMIVFVTVFISNIYCNVDHGTLPGGSVAIKESLKLSDFQFGMLGSVVYGGMTVGAAIATGVYQKSHLIKPTLLCSLLFNLISLSVFALMTNFYLCAFFRFLIGFWQVFVCIYMPVWVDMFAHESQKSAWLTFLILASPLGIVIGYSMTSVIVKHVTWQWAFWAQSIAMSPCVLAVILIPKKYIDVESASKMKSKSLAEVDRQLKKVI
jgi:predicted MFS family arabinose efflux permease